MDETKSQSENEGTKPPVEGSSGFSDGDVKKMGVTRSSDSWARAGSEGSILLTMTISTGRLPSNSKRPGIVRHAGEHGRMVSGQWEFLQASKESHI